MSTVIGYVPVDRENGGWTALRSRAEAFNTETGCRVVASGARHGQDRDEHRLVGYAAVIATDHRTAVMLRMAWTDLMTRSEVIEEHEAKHSTVCLMVGASSYPLAASRVLTSPRRFLLVTLPPALRDAE
jgi:hypothetical protein